VSDSLSSEGKASTRYYESALFEFISINILGTWTIQSFQWLSMALYYALFGIAALCLLPFIVELLAMYLFLPLS